MLPIRIAHVASTFCVALFAGLLYAFEQGVIPMLRGLDASAYVNVQQRMIVALDAFPAGVIAVATLGMLLPLYPLIALWRRRVSLFWRLTLLGWVLFFFGVSLFTIVLNVPINNQVLAMNAASPPADWQAARDSWNGLNAIRTPINYISLLAFLWAGFALPELERGA
jgi:uncharacterized membrane protein